MKVFGVRVGPVTVVLGLAALWAFMQKEPASNTPSQPMDYDPCCAYPCENQGVCSTLPGNRYTCDCTYTGYYGTNCTTMTYSTWFVKMIKPEPETIHKSLTSASWKWKLVNNIPFLSNMAMRYVFLTRGDMIDSPPRFESDHTYTTLDAYYNETYFARTLPAVPQHCPTPMGIVGAKDYPDVDEVIRLMFVRRKFIPDPLNTNVLFQYYAQHFTHQFFRTNYTMGPQFTKGNGGVDVSNIYGLTERDRRALRLGTDGKLRFQIIQGEVFPPHLRDVPGVSMDYPPNIPVPEEGKFALGHPFFALLPGLFVFSTVWLREHNRVCDVLRQEHPHWDDERLYHTARLIITGEVIKITLEDYVQHLSNYQFQLRFKPEVVHGTSFQFHNRINVEFDHLYHWHPLIPDGIQVNDTYYKLMDMAFNTAAVFNHGFDQFVHAMVTNRAGKMTVRNHVEPTLPIVRKMLLNSRAMRFQSINQYRKRFGLRPFKDFLDLCGDKDIAKDLEHLYGDVEAVEFYVGLVADTPGPSLMPLTIVNMGGPWSIKGLIANPICSPKWWRPSTFGGDKGFEIVKTASIQKLFCNNMKTKCKNIAFTVPPDTP